MKAAKTSPHELFLSYVLCQRCSCHTPSPMKMFNRSVKLRERWFLVTIQFNMTTTIDSLYRPSYPKDPCRLIHHPSKANQWSLPSCLEQLPKHQTTSPPEARSEKRRRDVRWNGVFFVTSYRGGLGYRGRRLRRNNQGSPSTSRLVYGTTKSRDVPSPSNAKNSPFLLIQSHNSSVATNAHHQISLVA